MVSVNGVDYAVPDNPGAAPFAFSANLGGLAADRLDVTIFGDGPWIFLSEATFDADAVADPGAKVPLPARMWLLSAAIGGLGFARNRRRS